MNKELEPYLRIERSISKKYRKEIWNPFVEAVKRYNLIQAGDKIAVCLSGGKDSMLMAKLMQMLQRFSEVPFELVFLVMDPGYSPANRRRIESNAALMRIPITVFETNIFRVADRAAHSACYLCAKMRRGHLYNKARELGCNKIALGHHLNDVIETTVMGMLYGSQLQAMIPKLHSLNYAGMELIRPLYCIREEAILAWVRYNDLTFIQCACRMTERHGFEDGDGTQSKRQEVKMLIRRLKRNNPAVETSIFNSIHAVCLDTFPGYKSNRVAHSFLENYTRREPDDAQRVVDYPRLHQQLTALLENVPHRIANLANAAALLYHELPGLNWAGFYWMQDGGLVLGPFQGNPACVQIAVGKGVCGTAVQLDTTQRVDDVHRFPGHIACDAASRSELVIPIHQDGAVVGVLDLDSPLPGRFTSEDQAGLEEFVRLLEAALFDG